MTPNRIIHPVPTRGGVTLAEVLVSLGIMSVGVITVATLFPLSVLRTVQATQLTHATIERYNVEALIDAIPTLVLDPDLDGNSAEHMGAGGNARPYVVDPLGFARYGTDGNAALRDQFANGTVRRFGFGVASTEEGFDSAADFVSSPDSWTEVVAGDPKIPGSRDSATFAEDLSAVSKGDRVVFFADNGRESVVRTITADPTGNTITFAAIPASLNVVEARIETQYIRYTWLLTVRNSSGAADVNVAVFFNRGLEPAEEQASSATYSTIPGPPPKYTATVVVPDSAKADVKAGGFMLDSDNLYWYRVEEIESAVAGAGNTTYTLVLSSSPKVANGNVLFLPHLVDVYPIGQFPK